MTANANICNDIQRDLGESFGTLACAATIKSNTTDVLSKFLAEVTTANVKLTTKKH
jgi:hypothetical protein